MLLRDPSLTAEEILMSESQERMMAIVQPGKLEGFLAVTKKWDVETSVLGEVTDTGRLVITWRGETIVDVDPSTVAVDGPVYERPSPTRPIRTRCRPTPHPGSSAQRAAPTCATRCVRLMGSANLADKSWVTNQYDRYVLGNTALSYPDDGGMVRVDETSGLGFAVATDANGRYCYLDPYRGAQLALAEAYRNVAVTGATPVAVSDCLNFGSPENPEVMWQFSQAVEGLADGCLELGIPVTGGNVSFYNQTGDVPIHPTPVVAVLGTIDDVARRVPSGWQDPGDNVYLLGTTSLELDGSAWAGVVHDHLGGMPPAVDLEREKALGALLAAAAHEGLFNAAHDLADGGLAAALVESSLRFGVGVRVFLDDLLAARRHRPGDGALQRVDRARAGRRAARGGREVHPALRGARLPGAAHRGDGCRRAGRRGGRGAGLVHDPAGRAARAVAALR